MRRLRLLVSAGLLCLPRAEAGQAGKFNQTCTSMPRHLWLSLQALEAKVEAQGYRIQKSRLTSTCAAFEALSDEWRTP